MAPRSEDGETEGAKKLHKDAKRAALLAEMEKLDAKRKVLLLEIEEVDGDEKPKKRKAKTAKLVEAEAAPEITAVTLDAAECGAEDDAAEQKRLKRAKKDAATKNNVTEGIEVNSAEANVRLKPTKRGAAGVTADAATCPATVESENDHVEAKKLRKAAKQAAAQAAAEKDATQNRSKNSSAVLTVFVGCISFKCSEATLWKDFSECGEIQDLNMPLTKDGRPGGFAFITFKTREGVVEALKYNGDEYGGRKLVVKIDGKVFVKGIPNGAKDEEVKEFFAACGDIQSLSVPRWPDGGAKGMAHINFSTQEGVEKALDLNGKIFRSFTLSVQKAAQGKGSKDRNQA